MEKCNQIISINDKCPDNAKYKVYWPGRKTLLLCEIHKKQAIDIASTLEFELMIEDYDKK